MQYSIAFGNRNLIYSKYSIFYGNWVFDSGYTFNSNLIQGVCGYTRNYPWVQCKKEK